MKKYDIAFGVVLVLQIITGAALTYFDPNDTVVEIVLGLLNVILLILLVYIYRKYMRDEKGE